MTPLASGRRYGATAPAGARRSALCQHNSPAPGGEVGGADSWRCSLPTAFSGQASALRNRQTGASLRSIPRPSRTGREAPPKRPSPIAQKAWPEQPGETSSRNGGRSPAVETARGALRRPNGPKTLAYCLRPIRHIMLTLGWQGADPWHPPRLQPKALPPSLLFCLARGTGEETPQWHPSHAGTTGRADCRRRGNPAALSSAPGHGQRWRSGWHLSAVSSRLAAIDAA
jgi:hypothetical protein